MPPLMECAPGPETVIDGVRYLYFGGTSYLGLASHPEVIAAGCAAMQQYGVHSATTRARVGTNPPVRDTEHNAAAYFATEDAFYFGSGYVANHIMLAALASEVDAIAIDQGSHYSLLDAARTASLPVLPFRHRDPEHLADLTTTHRRLLVMADAVCPSTGETAPVHGYLAALASHPSSILLLDDAHGFGVLGPNGRGLFDELGLWDRVNQFDPPDAGPTRLVTCGTLSKALGGFGGIIPGPRPFLDRLRRSSHFFDGASAPASAVAGASAKALEILLRDSSLRDALHRNSRHLRAGLQRLGLDPPDTNTAHLGLRVGSADNMQRIHHELARRGLMVPYVGDYTGLPDGGVLRIALFATHSPAQVDTLLAELQRLL